jgi:hypothetical protein
MKIFKYQFSFDENLNQHVVELELPQDARILHVDIQRDVPTLWCMVNPDAPLVKVLFYIYGTGQEVPENMWHINTFQSGQFVWHCFLKIAI